MSRPLRIECPDACHHIVNRERRGESVFRKKEDSGLGEEFVFFWKASQGSARVQEFIPGCRKDKGRGVQKYGVAMDELHRSRRGMSNEPRNVAIYLLRSLRGDNLEEICREFNIARSSSVSSVVERMRGKISGDRQLKNWVKEIKTAL